MQSARMSGFGRGEYEAESFRDAARGSEELAGGVLRVRRVVLKIDLSPSLFPENSWQLVVPYRENGTCPHTRVKPQLTDM